MSASKPSPHDRLAVLAEGALAALEAEAKAGKVPSGRELNSVRRVLDAVEARRQQDEELARLKSMTT